MHFYPLSSLKNNHYLLLTFILFVLFLSPYCTKGQDQAPIQIIGELKRWHKVTLQFEGPQTNETADPNPFSDFRLEVIFSQGATSYTVPGYYAADGDAANSSAEEGNKWIVHFSPDKTGPWNYEVSFTTGPDVAIEGGGNSAGFMDGLTGSIEIAETDKFGRDLRGKGRLEYVDKHYLRFAGSGEWFIKGGADAPENMLSYIDFDATPKAKKDWEPHAQDYDPADAQDYTWKEGKGKNMLGAIAYLASKGANAFSFLTFSLQGDDKKVFPHLSKITDIPNWEEVYPDRFDVSKLAQWEKIFEYADKKGMYLHIKTQEQENDKLMDGGDVKRERKLYIRELVARFGHHLALNWNLGEENKQTTEAHRAMAAYFDAIDPYDHLIVIHTNSGAAVKDRIYNPLLGDQSLLTGASLQTREEDFAELYPEVKKWVNKSAEAGKPWVVALDEPGSAQKGVDKDPNDRKLVRHRVLWATLMGGGAGVEYYYGYATGCSDLTCEDHRTRDQKYTDVGYAIKFFDTYFQPYFPDLVNDDDLTDAANDYVLRATNNQAVAIYMPNGGSTNIDLPEGDWTLAWYNPRTGEQGTTLPLTEGLTAPSQEDWVALITQQKTPEPEPEPEPEPDTAKIQLSVLLEGFMNPNQQTMNTILNEKDLLPTNQPFNTEPFNYTGTESVNQFELNEVDWVLIEIRQKDQLDQILARQATIVSEDGRIYNSQHQPWLSFPGLDEEEYWVAIYHKSHIPVVSSQAIPFQYSDPQLFDFTTESSQARGTDQLKQLGNVFTMFSGDFDQNGIINNVDFNLWKSNAAALNSYLSIDADGNGIVNSLDFNYWQGNRSKLGITELRK